MNRRTTISGVALAAFAVLAVAGCGDDDKDKGSAAASSAASAVASGQNGMPADGAQNGQPDAAAVQGLQAKIDEIVNASPVRFSPQSAELTDEAKATLKKVAKAAAAAPSVKVAVDTHAGYPDAAMATDLSQKRADAVREILTAGGIAGDRIKAKAEGSEGVGGDDAKAMTAEIKAAQ
ncbi:OmpA family protein [Amycolatopsis orientalis]|uniref:OmpA family protein n=1 Tax=Amycolatopsis orientalis TaxID=31958 RepID=UPI0003FE0BF0|nr:OmpA family protein [Amycolatopsis orientalis]